MGYIPEYDHIQKRYVHFLLFLVILFGFFFRIYKINFGLPDLLHLDEPFEINRALRLASGQFDFSRAGKGGLYYIICAEFAVSFLLLYLIGSVKTPMDFAYFFVSHEDVFYLMARITSCLIGTWSIYIIYKVGYRIGGKRTGLIASGLLAFSALNAQHSHYATVDICLIFFLLITWYYLFEAVDTGRKKDFGLAAFFGGISVVTKLSGIVIVIPFILTFFLCLAKKVVPASSCYKRFLLVLLIFTTTVFLSEPGYIKTVHEIRQSFFSIFISSDDPNTEPRRESHEAESEDKPEVNLYKFYSDVMVRDTGWAVVAAFMLSLGYFAVYRGSVYEVLMMSFFIPYFLAISSASIYLYFSRYALPLIPLIILMAARGGGEVLDYLKSDMGEKYHLYKITAATLLMLFFLPNFLNAARTVSQFGPDHPRIQAKKWFLKNVPEGATILMEGGREHRSQLLIPLHNSKKNIDNMINDFGEKDPGKKLYWKLRSRYLESLDAKTYDLRLIQNISPWIDYAELKDLQVEYIAIDISKLRVYKKRCDLAAKSRITFYQKLIRDADFVKIAKCSDTIEIFEKVSF